MITYPNLNHLQYFIDAVELGSISLAAQKNKVTHPAISRAISSIEKYLNLELLEHKKKYFKVTKTGFLVASHAKNLLTQASQFEALCSSPTTDKVLSIKIGISRTLTDIYLSSLLREIKKQFPKSNVQVKVGTTNEILRDLADDKIDLGLTIGGEKLASLKQTVLKSGQFIFIEKNSQRKKKIHLENNFFLITEPREETEIFKTCYHQKHGAFMENFFVLNSWELIANQVEQGLGVGLLPDIFIDKYPKKTFRIINIPWFQCSYSILLHQKKSAALNQLTQFATSNLTQGKISK